MTTRAPRFEVVRSDAGWFARFRAANGRIVWVTETYQRGGKALAAVGLISAGPIVEGVDGRLRTHMTGSTVLEVRTVDERQAVTR